MTTPEAHHDQSPLPRDGFLTTAAVRAIVIAGAAELAAIIGLLWLFGIELSEVPVHMMVIWAAAFAVVLAIQVTIILARGRE